MTPWKPPRRDYPSNDVKGPEDIMCPSCGQWEGNNNRRGKYRGGFACELCGFWITTGKKPRVHLQIRENNSLLIGERRTINVACGRVFSSRSPRTILRTSTDLALITCRVCQQSDHYHWRRHREQKTK